jgi:hypothetical protein
MVAREGRDRLEEPSRAAHAMTSRRGFMLTGSFRAGAH